MHPQCDLDEGDPYNPDRITSKYFATLKVSMTPEPKEFEAKENGAVKSGVEDDDEDDEGSIVASSVFAPSTVKSGSQKMGKTASGKGSQAVRIILFCCCSGPCCLTKIQQQGKIFPLVSESAARQNLPSVCNQRSQSSTEKRGLCSQVMAKPVMAKPVSIHRFSAQNREAQAVH